jgi:hypothetical protein
MDSRISIVAIVISSGFALLVFQLLRRNRLSEHYALLWIAIAVVVIVLGVWRSALSRISDLIGIAYPPTALFLIASAGALLFLLHLSIAVSSLKRDTIRLVQESALLRDQVERLESEVRDTAIASAPGQDGLAADRGQAEP